MGALNGVVEIPRKWTGLQPLISTKWWFCFRRKHSMRC
ncbi:hypothetical protein NC651_034319 [Populus alba x Populus x berolinensis]|nr:hypothetical protein NC651_034319 [Populus alba x Populus x berolinensis]